MKIKPSAKIKRRYLLLDTKSKATVEKIILEYVGVLGWAKAAPVFLEKNGKLILAIERKSLTDIRAAFEMCKNTVAILKVAATIKGLEK